MESVTINRLPCEIEESNETVDMTRFEKTIRTLDGKKAAIFQGRPLRATEYENENIFLVKQDGKPHTISLNQSKWRFWYQK